jgi:diketogulonate reductase-like aldo/keto reductase
VAIPKSVSKERIVANKEIYDFELSEEEMEKLYALDECESLRGFIFFRYPDLLVDLVTDWDVTDEI